MSSRPCVCGRYRTRCETLVQFPVHWHSSCRAGFGPVNEMSPFTYALKEYDLLAIALSLVLVSSGDLIASASLRIVCLPQKPIFRQRPLAEATDSERKCVSAFALSLRARDNQLSDLVFFFVFFFFFFLRIEADVYSGTVTRQGVIQY